MKKYLFYILLATCAVKAQAQQGDFQRTDKGTTYKMLSHNTGDRIKVSDVVTFNFTQKTAKDSVLFSTYQAGRPQMAQVQPTGDLMDVFPLLTVKDSVLIKVPTDTIFKNQEERRPPFLPKGSDLFFVLKVERVQSLAEAMAERDKAMAAAKAEAAKHETEEAGLAAKYIADKKLLVKTTPSGLKYIITKSAVGKPRPITGDTVSVNYTGSTLEGKVFDSSVEADAKKAGLDQPGRPYVPLTFAVGTGRVIPGWDEGLQLLREGERATFIIPSKLAYADQGAGADIKPFSTLVFNVELVKVKRGVHPVTTTAKPAAGKATTVRKTTVAKKTSTTKKKQ